jgi:hypothetical protein
MLRLFGGIAEFPENADETSPRELSGHVGHQLDFRTSAIFNANDAEVFARSLKGPRARKRLGRGWSENSEEGSEAALSRGSGTA